MKQVNQIIATVMKFTFAKTIIGSLFTRNTIKFSVSPRFVKYAGRAAATVVTAMGGAGVWYSRNRKNGNAEQHGQQSI